MSTKPHGHGDVYNALDSNLPRLSPLAFANAATFVHKCSTLLYIAPLETPLDISF